MEFNGGVDLFDCCYSLWLRGKGKYVFVLDLATWSLIVDLSPKLETFRLLRTLRKRGFIGSDETPQQNEMVARLLGISL
jgi:hypothetical protein